MNTRAKWLTWSLAIGLGSGGVPLRADIVLPGTQPGEAKINFEHFGASNCRKCHANTTNGPADIYFSWSGGMMAQAARDPVFRAALAIANQDLKDAGGYCIRCHSPRGWLAGRSSAGDASLLERDDLDGVSCSVCHRLVDPLSERAKELVKQVPPGYGDAMYVVDPEDVVFGPYPDPGGIAPQHKRVQSNYTASGELCANCHNVSNPTLALDVTNQPPHAFGHIERTYSEWALSDFAKGEHPQTCQSCHYPRIPAGGKATGYSGHRDYFVRHGPTGGSTWVQTAVYEVLKLRRADRRKSGDRTPAPGAELTTLDLDREALDTAKARAREFLKTAATLGLSCSNSTAIITVTNLTGHKLPTGYPEGRRVWLNVRFLGASGELLSELGRYGMRSDQVTGPQPVQVPTLLDPEKTRVYECKPGLSPAQAAKYNKAAGPSFHFILNDVITRDNRIPPRGFTNSAFADHLAAPAGARYEDGQYWDQFECASPPGTVQIEVRLMYQSVSWEYLKFLVEENRSDSWSKDLYRAWQMTGQCPPEEIAFATLRPGR